MYFTHSSVAIKNRMKTGPWWFFTLWIVLLHAMRLYITQPVVIKKCEKLIILGFCCRQRWILLYYQFRVCNVYRQSLVSNRAVPNRHEEGLIPPRNQIATNFFNDYLCDF